MEKKDKGYSFEYNVQQILYNMNVFIKGEGFKRKRLAQKLEISESEFSNYLQGENVNIFEFSAKLAEVLGLEGNYFTGCNFSYQSDELKQEQRAIVLSKRSLSAEGEEALHQLLRICELVETYDLETHSSA